MTKKFTDYKSDNSKSNIILKQLPIPKIVTLVCSFTLVLQGLNTQSYTSLSCATKLKPN